MWANYLPRAPGLRDSGLACLGAGEQSGRLPRTGRRTLSSHALVIVTDGGGFFRDESIDSDVRSPAWFWLFPGSWHEYGPTRPGWAEHWILFEGVATRGYGAFGAWDQRQPLEQGALSGDELRTCFDGLRAATETPGLRGQLVAASYVHRLIGLTAAARELPEARSAVQALIDGAAEPLPVAARARRLGISPEQLRTEVRTATGLSPHELVLRTRLNRAQQLLVASDLSVAAIAAQVGYDDPAYFSRLFARRIGVPPQTFRRQQRR